MEEARIWYLCDGEKPDCKKNTCYKRGGRCRHTKSIEHAANFEKRGEEANIRYWEMRKEKGPVASKVNKERQGDMNEKHSGFPTAILSIIAAFLTTLIITLAKML